MLIASFFSWKVNASDWLTSDEERHCIELTEAIRDLISEPGFFEQKERTISLKNTDAEFIVRKSGEFKDLYSNMESGIVNGANYYEKKGEGYLTRYYKKRLFVK